MSSDHSKAAVRAVVAIYREFEQIARKSDITLAQYRLLLYLRNGPRRAGAIAAAAEIAKPTASLAINGLRQKGWVESLGDADGRASVVVITAAGETRMVSFERELADAMGTMVGGEDLGNLTAVLSATYTAMAATKDARMKAIERGLIG